MIPSIAIYVIANILLLGASSFSRRTLPARYESATRIVQGIAGGALIICVGSVAWPRLLTRLYAYRTPLANTQQVLFEGIEYTRDVRREPHALVIHVVTVDLAAPGIEFLVTPNDPANGEEISARTTSQFLENFGLQVAINGDFFYPWWDISPLDYFPHSGDTVDVLGFASSKGKIYSEVRANHSTIFLWEDNRVSFDERIGEVHNALSGNVIFVRDGKPHDLESTHSYYLSPHPRTAIGLDRNGRVLIIVVIDGRQPGYSDGATMQELAEIMIEYGAVIALNLDGGGSSTLVIEGADGKPVVLNAPIHNQVPYRERPIANHLGIYALRAGDEFLINPAWVAD